MPHPERGKCAPPERDRPRVAANRAQVPASRIPPQDRANRLLRSAGPSVAMHHEQLRDGVVEAVRHVAERANAHADKSDSLGGHPDHVAALEGLLRVIRRTHVPEVSRGRDARDPLLGEVRLPAADGVEVVEKSAPKPESSWTYMGQTLRRKVPPSRDTHASSSVTCTTRLPATLALSSNRNVSRTTHLWPSNAVIATSCAMNSYLGRGPPAVLEVTAAPRCPRMDERDVRRKRDAGGRARAQHFLTHRAVAAVDVLHGDAQHAVPRALEGGNAAQSEPEWRDARARDPHPLDEQIADRRFLRVGDRDVSGDLCRRTRPDSRRTASIGPAIAGVTKIVA